MWFNFGYFLLILILIFNSIAIAHSEVTKSKKQVPKKVDMSKKVGLGGGILLLNNVSTPFSALSVKYWATPNLGFQFNLGFMFTEREEEIPGIREGYVYSFNNTLYEYDIGGRVLFNFIRKSYSTFYCAAGAGTLLMDTSRGEIDGTHLTLNGAIGTEFFIPWIKELGTSFELGLNYRGVSADFTEGANYSF